MNAKRQTIWLVSMLSLMVVLSAYYLFTEDVNKLDLASTQTINKSQEVKIDMSQVDPANAAKTDVKATTGGDAKVDTKAVTPQNSTKTDVKTDAKTTTTQDASKTTNPNTAKTDDQVLKIVEEQAKTTSASDYFTTEQMKQSDYFSKTSTALMEIITDSKKSPEAVVKATNDLAKLTDIQDKVENIEAVLMKDFPQAIINQDGNSNKWKVTVQSDKLEKSQGVTIVDLVMKELGTGPENIKIQYVRP